MAFHLVRYKDTGKRALLYSVDAQEGAAKGVLEILDRHPAPRTFFIDNPINSQNILDPGVLGGSQLREPPGRSEAHLEAQVQALDAQHEAREAERTASHAVNQRRREVAGEAQAEEQQPRPPAAAGAAGQETPAQADATAAPAKERKVGGL